MNPPDRRQAREAPSPTYSNWTFYPQQLLYTLQKRRKPVKQNQDIRNSIHDSLLLLLFTIDQ